MIDIVILLDRSGSMQTAKADHEGGIRSFVEEQRKQPGDVRLTLIQFDSVDPREIVYDRTPLAQVGEIVLTPRAWTPLLDAVGLSIAHIESAQRAAPSEATVFMVVTDGQENASKEWTSARVKSAVADAEKRGWSFLFLGANIDAFKEAGSVGMRSANTMSFRNDSRSVGATYKIVSEKMSDYRTVMYAQGSVAAAEELSFTAEERAKAMSGAGALATSPDITGASDAAAVSGGGSNPPNEGQRGRRPGGRGRGAGDGTPGVK